MRLFRRRPVDCRRVAALMQAYLDGELPESETATVAAHLDDCVRCGIDADVYRRVKAAVHGLRTPADRDVVQRLHSYAQELPRRDAR